MRGVLDAMTAPVSLLDITALSQLRIDAHPSVYAGPGRDGMDCTHWCIAGLPDAWNHVMYAMLLQQSQINRHHAMLLREFFLKKKMNQ